MASIRRQGDRYEIRECLNGERGPRQRALARFHGVLTPEVLEAAARAARRPFDRDALVKRARERGIPVSLRPGDADARRLLARLRAGDALDPTLVALLQEARVGLPKEPVPEHLRDVVDWLGRSESARGKALRGLLRTAGRILSSRGPVRERPPEPFPRFCSRAGVG
jgi:hypothetical protein